ncbi:Hypothetical protein NTJ_02840 [Nesidiocoris tenuis]|uniref:Uncharacterized protein n=1 Tax=Nesidiocoris tenuis TaxID=355587 RepID=A0ABN7ADC7_9HEMI|nr:Hypothetical protein NTJ_02840 [Nesidiocoris tenuis]
MDGGADEEHARERDGETVVVSVLYLQVRREGEAGAPGLRDRIPPTPTPRRPVARRSGLVWSGLAGPCRLGNGKCLGPGSTWFSPAAHCWRPQCH